MELVKEVYKLTTQLPTHERFGLTSQLQRAAVSIPSNIAEGSKRSSRTDFRQFCLISLGSAAEVETQLLIINQLYPAISTKVALQEISEIQKMLTVLASKLHKTL